MKEAIKSWFMHMMAWVPVLVSQAWNVVFYMGHPDETVSARAHRSGASDPAWEKRRLRLNKWWNIVAGWPVFRRFMIESDDHCADSFADDLQRAGQILSWHGYRMRHNAAPDAEIEKVDV